MDSQGFCVWFTGLGASGKTTLAQLLRDALVRQGRRVEVLDEEALGRSLCRDLGFGPEDREAGLRRIAFVANLLARNGVAVIVAASTQSAGIRREIRSAVAGYVEIFLNAPLDVCIQRDPKGLYKRALAGEIEHYIGVGDPFEPPRASDLVLLTHEETPQDSLARVLAWLEELALVRSSAKAGYTAEEEEQLKKRLADLGYM